MSEATVSRVLCGVGPVKELTKRRVMEAAERVGYMPSAIARSFVLQQSGNIGVMLPVIPNVRLFSAYYFSEILSGIGHVVEQRGFSLLLHFHGLGEPPQYSSIFRSKKVDGCIILGATSNDMDMNELAQMHQQGWPFCVVGQHYELPYCRIDADHVDGATQAVTHLIQQGHNKILMLNGPSWFSNSLDRKQGYEAAHRAAGLEIREQRSLQGNYSRKSGLALAEQVYAMRDDFDAIFAANDRMAIGMMQGLMERGMVAGRDYAIVGYDDSDSSRVTTPPLSSVQVPFFEMGMRAAEILLDQLSGKISRESGCHECLSTKLVVRASSHLGK